MITVKEATDIILKHTIELETEQVPLGEAIGRVLRENLYADRDFPPFDRVTMDGIAIRYRAFAEGLRDFPVRGIAAAGAPQQRLEEAEACLEVMTGAMLPSGVDTVIRYEDIELQNGTAHLQINNINKGENIHRQGSDRPAGSEVVKAGKLLSSAEVGVAATVGKGALRVAKMPRAIIISTGDELVEVDETPEPYQIRKSNVHRLKASLRQKGVIADSAHLQDDLAVIKTHLAEYLETYQAILLSGGVSEGKFDYLPEALDSLGVKKLFHRIAQRPGKPFWFGQAPNGAVVFAFPGNPVSSFLCSQRYFFPWLQACLQLPPLKHPFAVLAEDFTFKPDLTYFLQVAIRYDQQGRILAIPEVGNGSGDLANLVEADGFLELPRGRDFFKAGEVFPYWGFR